MQFKWIVSLALVCFVALAGAQGRQIRIITPHYPLYPLFRDPVVLRDLKVSSDQKRRIDSFLPSFAGGKLVVDSKDIDSSDQNIFAVLTPDQKKRTDQILIQYYNPRIVLRNDISKLVHLSDAQRDKINEVQHRIQKEAMTELIKNSKGSVSIDKSKSRLIVQRTSAAINKILTAGQRAALVKMGGRQVHFTDHS